MSVREQIQQNPIVVGVIAVAVIIGCIVWITSGSGSAAASDEVYFYDLQTGELFTGARDAQPPIDAPSGANNGVKASVYTCGKCTQEQMRVGFVTTYNERAREAMDKQAALPEGEFRIEYDQAIDQGMLVATPAEDGGAPRWIPAMSPQGITVTGRIAKFCDGEPATPCLP